MHKIGTALGVAVLALALAVGMAAAQDGPSEQGLEAQDVIDLCVAERGGDPVGEEHGISECVRDKLVEAGLHEHEAQKVIDTCVAERGRGEAHGLGDCVSEAMQAREHGEAGERGADGGPDGGPPPDPGPPGGPPGQNR